MNIDNWTAKQPSLKIQKRISENKNLETVKRTTEVVKKPMFIWQEQILNESLILAQDERWRRA